MKKQDQYQNIKVDKAGRYMIGDIQMDSKYWDCECEENYIHSKDEKSCKKCKAKQEEQPDSIAKEVEMNNKVIGINY